MISLAEQIACVKREVALRVNTYPKWIRSARMKEHVAQLEIQRMQAVLETLIIIEGNVLMRQEIERGPMPGGIENV